MALVSERYNFFLTTSAAEIKCNFSFPIIHNWEFTEERALPSATHPGKACFETSATTDVVWDPHEVPTQGCCGFYPWFWNSYLPWQSAGAPLQPVLGLAWEDPCGPSFALGHLFITLQWIAVQCNFLFFHSDLWEKFICPFPAYVRGRNKSLRD